MSNLILCDFENTTNVIYETTDILREESQKRGVLSTDFHPERSMFTLEEQLSNLKQSVGRIKYYMLELDDLASNHKNF